MYVCVYKSKVDVRSQHGDADNFDIVTGVLQEDTLAPYLFISLDYELKMSIDIMKVNGFKLTKERSWRYSAQTITDADYADDIAPVGEFWIFLY